LIHCNELIRALPFNLFDHTIDLIPSFIPTRTEAELCPLD
jgi:hypothetical protein